MTEIPEHLMQRSRAAQERYAAKGQAETSAAPAPMFPPFEEGVLESDSPDLKIGEFVVAVSTQGSVSRHILAGGPAADGTVILTRVASRENPTFGTMVWAETLVRRAVPGDLGDGPLMWDPADYG